MKIKENELGIEEVAYPEETPDNLEMATKLYDIHYPNKHSRKLSVTGDPEKAAPYLKKAAEASEDYLGCPEAQYRLAELYLLDVLKPSAAEGDRIQIAVSYYEKAAQQDFYDANVKLGQIYMLGVDGIAVDTSKAVECFKRAIGNKVVLWDSAPLGYLLKMCDQGDQVAKSYLGMKLQWHKNKFFEKLTNIKTLIQSKGVDSLVAVARKYRYGRSYMVPQPEYSDINIEHLQQIIYLADSGDSDIFYRNSGYVIAKQVLVDIFNELSHHMKGKEICSALQKVALGYQTAMEQQIEDEKPKPKTPEELLWEALKNDSVDEFSRLLSVLGLNVNSRFGGMNTPLICLAAQYGSYDIIRSMITDGVDILSSSGSVEAAQRASSNPLVKVCSGVLLHARKVEQRIKIATILLQKGISINSKDSSGYSALHSAALYDFHEMMTFLLGKGAEIDQKDSLGRTPLNLYIDQSHDQFNTKTLEILLEKGADVTAKDKCGFSPLSRARYNASLNALLLKYKKPDQEYELSRAEREMQQLMQFASRCGLFGSSGDSSLNHASFNSDSSAEGELENPNDQENHAQRNTQSTTEDSEVGFAGLRRGFLTRS